MTDPLSTTPEELLLFTPETFESHAFELAAWESKVGTQLALVGFNVALAKQNIENLKLIRKRREAQLRQEMFAQNRAAPRTWTEAAMETEIVLDIQVMKIEDDIAKAAYDHAAIEYQFYKLRRELIDPLNTKASMLMLISGQAREERRALNQQAGRTQ